jgi:hypothetical protein
LVRKAELGKSGIADPFAEHRKRPLAEHLDEWEAALLASGATAKHVNQTVASVRRVLDGCGFVFMADLSGSRVQQFLADLRKSRRALPPLPSLDPEEKGYTKRQLAALLAVKLHF